MRVEFASSHLQDLCTYERIAVQSLGKACAKKLFARLADLSAAAHVRELVAGHPHPLKGDRSGEFAVGLEGGRRIVFVPTNDPIPRHADGSIDWKQVTQVKILFIGDYHD